MSGSKMICLSGIVCSPRTFVFSSGLWCVVPFCFWVRWSLNTGIWRPGTHSSWTAYFFLTHHNCLTLEFDSIIICFWFILSNKYLNWNVWHNWKTLIWIWLWQDSNLDVQTLIERILRLKTMVRDANKRSKHPIDLDELLEMTVDNESAAK